MLLRLPALVVKPVNKRIEAIVCQLHGGTIVEVWVELMDHQLEADHCEKPNSERQQKYTYQGGASQQELLYQKNILQTVLINIAAYPFCLS